MRSFTTTAVAIMVVMSRVVDGRVVRAPAQPVITPAPSIEDLVKRQDPDSGSLALVLLTAVPEWIRQVAATNVPAASSIINEEFEDGNRPWWFTELPWNIQSYLIKEFGPATAVPDPTENPSYSATATGTAGVTSQSAETSLSPSQPSETASFQGSSSATLDASQSTQTPSASQTTSESQSTSAVTSSKQTRSASSKDSTTQATSGTSSAKPTSTSEPQAPASSNNSSLTRSQKIGVGIGVPFAILAMAAAAFACCFLIRRRRQKRTNGSIPPSSPGFIPRFAFQEKMAADPEQHQPLSQSHHSSSSFGDLHNMAWDEEIVDYSSSSGESVPTLNSHPQPVMAPALFHTHSSNRARGKRTSYTSLHSVAEVTEPDENEELESPVLGRNQNFPRNSTKRLSPPRSLIPPPPVPAASKIKRKPVPSGQSPAAHAASQSLLRQTMPEHQPAAAMPTFGNTTRIAGGPSTPVSPIEEHNPVNPFSDPYHYEEDYGPEYHTIHNHSNSYVDVDDGLYGGNRSLSRYPNPKPSSSKTEWPLRNISANHRRNKSPLWEHVYDG